MSLLKQARAQATNLEQDQVPQTGKVERYHWKSLGPQGTYMMIPKGDLRVDKKYQRDASNPKVLRIAASLNWAAFAVLVVMRRPSGYLYVVEGQHRFLAAMKRDDIDEVPCLVFESTGAAEEAGTFITANADRRPVAAVAKFKAMLVAKDKNAIEVSLLVDAADRNVSASSGPSTVACVRLLILYFEKGDGETLKKIWPVLVELCDGHSFHDRIIQGFMYIEKHLPDGVSITDSKWKERILRVGHSKIHSQMTAAQAFYAKGGARVWADGALNAINKSLKSENQLRLAHDIDDSRGDDTDV